MKLQSLIDSLKESHFGSCEAGIRTQAVMNRVVVEV